MFQSVDRIEVLYWLRRVRVVPYIQPDMVERAARLAAAPLPRPNLAARNGASADGS